MFENNEEIVKEIFETIKPEEFSTEIHKKIADRVYSFYLQNNLNPSAIIDRLEENELRRYIFTLTIKEESISHRRWKEIITEQKIKEDLKKFAEDTIKRYKLLHYDEELKAINRELLNASSEVEEMNLLKKNKELQLKKAELINGD